MEPASRNVCVGRICQPNSKQNSILSITMNISGMGAFKGVDCLCTVPLSKQVSTSVNLLKFLYM